LSESQQEYLGFCAKAGDALRTTVDSLLDIEAVTLRGRATLKCTACNAGDLARNALEQVIGLARDKKIETSLEIDPDLPALSADAEKLVRVLVNLLGNAIKFTPQGGRVGLSVYLHINPLTRIIFAVSDSGKGIAASDTEKILEEGVKLDQESSSRESLGLGLAFCKKIVEAHGGEILVRSRLGEGSSFFAAVPISAVQNN
jgi:signal transduction histidine kinase